MDRTNYGGCQGIAVGLLIVVLFVLFLIVADGLIGALR